MLRPMEYGAVRKNLCDSTAISRTPAGSPQSASSAPEGSVEVNQSTAAHEKTSQVAANPATAHPSQSVRTSGLESGDDSEQLLRQEQAALMLEVTPRCLENWRHRGGGIGDKMAEPHNNQALGQRINRALKVRRETMGV